MNNIKSGDDYAKDIIRMINESEKEFPINERTPKELLWFWFEEIEILADKKWIDYITGKSNTYKFTEKEMMNLYDKSNERYTSEILNGLVDKGMVKVAINKEGGMEYSITEEGRKTTNKAR